MPYHEVAPKPRQHLRFKRAGCSIRSKQLAAEDHQARSRKSCQSTPAISTFESRRKIRQMTSCLSKQKLHQYMSKGLPSSLTNQAPAKMQWMQNEPAALLLHAIGSQACSFTVSKGILEARES